MIRLRLFSLILVYLFLIPVYGLSQGYDNSNPGIADSGILVGEINRLDLQDGVFGNYFFKEYEDYQPDSKVLNKIDPQIFELRATIVLGTWCHDSEVQIPRLFKLFDKINYNANTLEIIGVDKNKYAGEKDISHLNIKLVPTIIFYKDDIEVGRIIETPENSLEKDILNILIN